MTLLFLGEILPGALSLYMDKDLPLPYPDEMLMCTEQTTAEQVHIIACYCLRHRNGMSVQSLNAHNFESAGTNLKCCQEKAT